MLHYILAQVSILLIKKNKQHLLRLGPWGWLLPVPFPDFRFSGPLFFSGVPTSPVRWGHMSVISLPKVGAHNRVPSKQLYYWVTEPLMRYPLEKLFGCCFFNKGLIRHLIIWETLHFKALTQLWLSTVKGPALPKQRWRKGFVFFSLPKVCAQNRVPSKQLYYWVTEPSWGTPLKNCLGAVF